MNWRPDQPEQAHGAATQTCPLKFDSRTLSDWRDGQLSQAMAASVQAHLSTDDCPACQARLDDYGAIGALLRTQRVPRAAALDMEALRPGLVNANAEEGRSLLRLLPFRSALAVSPGSPADTVDAGDALALADTPLATRATSDVSARSPIPLASRSTRSQISQRRLHFWRGLSATVAAALIVVALAQLLLHAGAMRNMLGSHSVRKGTPSALETATARPYHPVRRVVWRQATLPPGFAPDQYSSNTFAVAPSDGDTAYTCYPTGDPAQTAPQFWVTHDAHTWRQLTTFPTSAHGWCAITVDQNDPDRMIVGLASPGPPDTPTNGPDSYFATENGGHSWRQVSGLGNTDLLTLATTGSAYYALLQPEPYTSSTQSALLGDRLVVSRDGMKTWLPAGNKPFGGSDTQSLQQIWANPFTNEMAALTEANGDPSQQYLWESVFGGGAWRLVSHIADAQYLVQQPIAGRAWAFCAYNSRMTPGDYANPDQVICSPVDADEPTVRTGVGGTFTRPNGLGVLAGPYIALTAHGDLLVIGQGVNPQALKSNDIYRLPVGSSTWQDLGSRAVPGQLVLYAPTANGGEVLWELPTADAPYGPIDLVEYATP